MKKFAVLFLALILSLAFSVNAFAAEVSFGSESSGDGNLTVEVNLSDEGEPCMVQFCVAYDPSVIECVSAVSGEVFAGESEPLINITNGKIYFIWDSLKPLKEGGTLLKIEFSQKTDNKDISVGIDESEDFIIANSKFEEIGSVKGSVEIAAKVPSSNEKEPEESSSSKIEEKEENSSNTSSEKTPSAETSSPEEIKPSDEAESEVLPEEENPKNESLPEENKSGEIETIEVISPRAEKEEKTPAAVWIAVAFLAVVTAAVLFVLFTKIIKREKLSEGRR